MALDRREPSGCADDDLLAIDNASELPPLRQELAAIAAEDSRVRVIERTSNDLQLNAKVGSLYQAYHQAILRDPDGAGDAHYNLGLLLEARGRREDAMRHLMAARRLYEGAKTHS